MAALEQLVSDGKIRSWGVSNFDAGDLAELRDVAGDGKIACNQVLYHLNERAIEHWSFHGAKRMGSRLWRIRHLVMTISRSSTRGRQASERHRIEARRDAVSGGAGLSGASPVSVCDPKGVI